MNLNQLTLACCLLWVCQGLLAALEFASQRTVVTHFKHLVSRHVLFFHLICSRHGLLWILINAHSNLSPLIT